MDIQWEKYPFSALEWLWCCKQIAPNRWVAIYRREKDNLHWVRLFNDTPIAGNDGSYNTIEGVNHKIINDELVARCIFFDVVARYGDERCQDGRLWRAGDEAQAAATNMACGAISK